MPVYHQVYSPGELQFITASTYRRTPIFLSERFRNCFANRLELERLRLPPTVHDESHYRLWQRRFYPFGVFSDKKYEEKLDYMHNNPVVRGLVNSRGEWAWSSWRFYYREDDSILRMDRVH